MALPIEACLSMSQTRRTGAPLAASWHSAACRGVADRIECVPAISGRVEINLTVRDPASSAAWYSELLDLEDLYDFTAEDGRMHYVALVEPNTKFVFCLVGHQEQSGEPFSEFHTGLDHLEFLVDRKQDLNEGESKLNQLGIPHSG
jgi:glyoxylase I family protein